MKAPKQMKPMMSLDPKMAQMMSMMHGGSMPSVAPTMPEPMPPKQMPPRGMKDKQHAPQKRK